MKKISVALMVMAVTLCLLPLSGSAAVQTPQQLMQTARELSLDGKFGQARKLYEQLIRQFPQSDLVATALFWQAYAFEAEGEPQRAVPLYGEMVKKYPKNDYADDALQKRANILKSRKEYRLMAESLQTLTSNYPESPFQAEALFELAEVYGYQLDKFDLALAAYEKYPAGSVKKAEAEHEIMFFKENRDFEDVPLKIYCKAYRAWEMDELETVETLLKNVIVNYPKSVVVDDVLLLLGRNEVARGMKLRLDSRLMSSEQKRQFSKHYQNAAKYYEQVIRDFPKKDTAAQAQYYLALSYGREDLGGVNDFEAARREYQKLIKNYPKSYWAQKGQIRLQALDEIF